jgi:hypothetical protein
MVERQDHAGTDVALIAGACRGRAVLYEPPHLEGERLPRLPLQVTLHDLSFYLFLVLSLEDAPHLRWGR